MQNLSIKNPAGLRPIHFILLVAVLLRLPYVFIASYTHDELSALYHLEHGGFKNMWQYVLHDYHPPLVQFFLYGYTRVFGQAEWIVKLPFALCGLAAVWMVYKTGRAFFNEPAALFAAAFTAVTQVFVFHSNVARPYAPGLLFCTGYLYSWLNMIVHRDTSMKTKTMCVVFAVLAGTTHYFAGLTAGVAGILGLLMIKRSELKPYLLTHILVAVLFIPLLYVMKIQLSHGGLGGWLEAPGENYIGKFIFYHFHYSLLFLACFIAIILVAVFFMVRKPKKFRPHWVMAAVFLVVFSTAYFYSLYVSPVMQFSIMQFVLPFLLLPVFSVLGSIGNRMIWMTFLVAFTGTGIYSLFFTRHHHQMVNDYPYKAFADFCQPYLDEKKLLIVTSDRPEFIARYMKTDRLISTYGQSQPWFTVLEEIKKRQPEIVISGNNHFITYSMLRSFYPAIIESREGFLNNFFALIFSSPAQVPFHQDERIQVPLAHTSAQTDSVVQYVNLVDTSVAALRLDNKSQLGFHAWVQSNKEYPGMLVVELHENDTLKHWYGSDLVIRPGHHFTHCFAFYDLAHELRKSDPEKTRLKVYLWNNRLLKSHFSEMKISFKKPNKKFYGLTEDFNR